MNAMIQHGRVGLVVFYAAMVTCFSFLCQLKAAAERSGVRWIRNKSYLRRKLRNCSGFPTSVAQCL